MQIGPYTINILETGTFALDGGAMFGIVPKPLWEKRIPADTRNRIPMHLRCLLLRGTINGAARVMLIDTGMGDKWDAKSIDIYNLAPTPQRLLTALAEQGITPEQVTDVILTHLHFDHAGGATRRTPDGRVVPTFPHATYYVQKTHLDWAEHPTDKDRGSFFPDNFLPLLEHKQLVTFDGPSDIFPHISFRLSNGHTTAMQHPLIADEHTALFFCADLLPTSAHVALPWIMGYDIRPLISLEDKQALLAEAQAGNWLLVFEHCPLMACGRLTPGERGLRAVATSI